MTDADRDRLARLESVENRSVWRRRLGIAVLVLIVVGVTAGFAILLSISAENNRILEDSEEARADSERAAVGVAQEKQDQARSVSDLCESGEIDQDTERGKRVCEEAQESATQDPEEVVQGAAGPQGATGERGPQGLPGQPGETGPPGADGADGAPGANGEAGPKGDQGLRGMPGEKGAVGSAGQDGSSGPAGPAGPGGEDGGPGEPGAAGAPGPRGEPGSAGPQGPTGERGPAGAAGERGPAGPAGADGKDGADGRGIASLVCAEDGRWDVTYTDGAVEDGGVCREVEEPEPEPTEPTEPEPEPTDPEATEPPPSAMSLSREQETVEVWPPAAAA